MKKKFLIKIFSVFVALGLAKTSVVLAKEEKKVEQQQEKRKDIEKIRNFLKEFKISEEKTQEKMLKRFKFFNKKDFELKNYNLEVFKKFGVPILVYTHKKTGAQVFFSLFLDKEKLKQEKDKLIFRAPSKDDSGLIHFTEHAIASPLIKHFQKKLQISGDELNAFTTKKLLGFECLVKIIGLNEKLEKEYVEKLAKNLKKPSAFEKEDKTFEIEKKRILNEIKDSKQNYKENDLTELTKLRDYDPFGDILKIKKTTLKDLKVYYKKYIHPSNCLLIKNVFELNPKKIKSYLNLWHESYFKHYEKKQIIANKYEPKNKEKYLFNSWPKDSKVFLVNDEKTNKEQNFKFKATVVFDLENLALNKTEGLEIFLEYFKDEIEKFAKNLGYEKVKVGYEIQFFGNKKECFLEKVLEENSKKIMSFIDEKLKNLSEEDLLYFTFYDFKDFDELKIKELNFLNSSPESYKGFPFSHLAQLCFSNTGKAISKKEFLIKKNNELETSYEGLFKNLKENLNIYGKIAKNNPKYITVFKQNNKTLKQTFEKETKKYEIIARVLPIKFKEKNSKKFVKDFATILLAKCLNEELNDKKGLIYSSFKPGNYFENDFLINYFLNKDSIKNLEDYIFNNFDEIKKSVKVTKNNLNELKKQFKENFNLFKLEFEEYFKNENKTVKDLKNYIKTGKIDKNSVLKENFKIKDLIRLLPKSLIIKLNEQLFTFYDGFKDYQTFFEKEMAFKEKYLKFNEKINPKIVKDFLENLYNLNIKKTKKAFKLAKEKLKALEQIKFSEVEDLIKTAYLVEDKEEIKKVNQNVKKREKRIANF